MSEEKQEEITLPEPAQLQSNPVQPISVSVNIKGQKPIGISGSPDEVCKAIKAFGHVDVTVGRTPPATARKKGKKKTTPKKKVAEKPKTKTIDPNKFYAVFYDEQNNAVHTTRPRRLWSETRIDTKAWIGKHGEKAKTVVIYQGDTQAASRGSRMERARTAWHSVE